MAGGTSAGVRSKVTRIALALEKRVGELEERAKAMGRRDEKIGEAVGAVRYALGLVKLWRDGVGV